MLFLCWRHLNALYSNQCHTYKRKAYTTFCVRHMWTSFLTRFLYYFIIFVFYTFFFRLLERLLHSFSLITSRQQCREKLFAPQIVPIKLLNQATERFPVNFHKIKRVKKWFYFFYYFSFSNTQENKLLFVWNASNYAENCISKLTLFVFNFPLTNDVWKLFY